MDRVEFHPLANLFPMMTDEEVNDLGDSFEVVSEAGDLVKVRTALQEEVDERWMAMVMSLNESITEGAPGAGILLAFAILSARTYARMSR